MPGINGHEPKAYFGSWRNWEAVSGYFSDAWRTASDVYVNHNGTWKQVWVRLTAPTNGSRSISDTTVTISWTPGVGQEGFKLYRDGAFVKNVAANATSTTDPVPALNTNYTYTISAYSGSTETAQISCGDEVGNFIPKQSCSVSINRNWTYVNDTWDNIQINFVTSCTNLGSSYGYEYSWDDGASSANQISTNSTIFALAQDGEYNVRWRSYRMYNGLYYAGPWSDKVNVKAGRPLKRLPRNDDVYFDAWLDKEIYYYIAEPWPENGFTTLYGFTTTIVDSYQFRNLDASTLPAGQITSDSRSITISKPGTNIVLSGTPYVSNGWDSAEFAWTGDATFRVNPSGLGWYNFNNSRKLTGYVRFKTRYVSQTPIAYSIS